MKSYQNNTADMEITLNIPQNKWSKPDEVREEVVQMICDVFLQGSYWHSLYHALVDNSYGLPRKDFADKGSYYYENKYYIEFRECEMKTAFHALKKAGYHFERWYTRRSSYAYYKLTPKNYCDRPEVCLVPTFSEQWD